MARDSTAAAAALLVLSLSPALPPPQRRPIEAIRRIERALELRESSSGWYELGQIYNDVAREAIATAGFEQDPAWARLLAADELLQRRHYTDAFALYREASEGLLEMIGIHDSVARIYDATGHPDWAVEERRRAAMDDRVCAAHRALCEFRAGRHRAALEATLEESDRESLYWRARAATELALAAFRRVETLPDSRERRGVRAAIARADERFTDAVVELKAALEFAPGDLVLLGELAAANYAARDFDGAMAAATSLLKVAPDDRRAIKMVGFSLLELRRGDEAVSMLRRAVELDPQDLAARLALGRAYLQTGRSLPRSR